MPEITDVEKRLEKAKYMINFKFPSEQRINLSNVLVYLGIVNHMEVYLSLEMWVVIFIHFHCFVLFFLWHVVITEKIRSFLRFTLLMIINEWQRLIESVDFRDEVDYFREQVADLLESW